MVLNIQITVAGVLSTVMAQCWRWTYYVIIEVIYPLNSYFIVVKLFWGPQASGTYFLLDLALKNVFQHKNLGTNT